VRRHGTTLAVATSRPSSLDPNARSVTRFAPGTGEAVLLALEAALGGSGDLDAAASAAGVTAEEIRALATTLRGAGDELVVLFGERLLSGPRGANAARVLLTLAERLNLSATAGAGLIEVPSAANGRGLREVGVSPATGPGYADVPGDGAGARAIAEQLTVGELSAVYLLDADPLRSHPDRVQWETALDAATTVVVHADRLSPAVEQYATVVFPLEAYAEKEGRLTHPDGRVQRLRQAIGRPGRVIAGWQVIADVAARVGLDLEVRTASAVSALVFDAVPFYARLSLEELGGRGVRWPQREQAAAVPDGESGPFELEAPRAPERPAGKLRIGRYHPLWAAPEVEVSPTLRFLAFSQQVELSPADAQRFGVEQGQDVVVAANGHSVRGTVELRAAAQEGTVFLADGLERDGANALGDQRVAEVRPA